MTVLTTTGISNLYDDKYFFYELYQWYLQYVNSS